jgi:hypothetical protein
MQVSISEDQKRKYHPTLHESSIPLKSALDIMSNLDLILSYGLDRLSFGMQQWAEVDKFPSFDYKDPYIPYELKNFYSLATNSLFICKPGEKCPWTILPPSLCEIYFDTMLKTIKDYEHSYKNEKKSEYNFNKGMVYANLGVAQASQMKIDEGFANILKALIEDFGYSSSNKPEFDTFKRILFTQFENRYVKEHLMTIIPKLNILGVSQVEQFVNDFLDSLNDDQRAFFNFTFARIIQNWGVWKDKENSFTANRLLAYTQDFCLFNEDLLKSKISKRVLKTKSYWTLKDLIPKKFPKINIANCGANTMDELDNKLPAELKRQDPKEKCLRILLTLRNYSSHNIRSGTGSDCFYACYEEIFRELVRAMCYIRLLP